MRLLTLVTTTVALLTREHERPCRSHLNPIVSDDNQTSRLLAVAYHEFSTSLWLLYPLLSSANWTAELIGSIVGE